MVRIFHTILMALLLGCYSFEYPKITRADLKKSVFVFCDASYCDHIINWNDFSKKEQAIILEWLECSANGLKVSVNTYAPNIIIKGERYSINFTRDLVVYNYQINHRKWRQGIRQRNVDDLKVINCIMRRMKDETFF